MAKAADLIRAAGEADHWSNFAEFCRWEMKAGGPDPHMRLAARMAENDGADWLEQVWRGLCYLGVYNVPTAAAVWNEWPWVKARGASGKFTSWLGRHWKGGIALRRERKAVLSPVKLGRYFDSAVQWLRDKQDNGLGWIGDCDLSPRERYDTGWEDVQSIYAMGRYVANKFLEYARRYLNVNSPAYDIRSRGGWSPREGLALLWPYYAETLCGDDSPEACAVADHCASQTRTAVQEQYGLDLDYYNLQVLLCDYKQCYVGRRQFPGRSQDSEIAYERKIAPHWGRNVAMYAARRQIFPTEVLGEVRGWNRVREELGDCLAVHGYMWSDFCYDYLRSRHNLARPVSLAGAPRDNLAHSGAGGGNLYAKEILPGVFQRGEFRKRPSSWKLAQLKRLGVGVVVCLINQSDPDLHRALGKRYVHLPIPDGRVVEPLTLLARVKEVGDWIEGGGRVLVHCRAGRNRSSLFSALLAVRLRRMSGRQAAILLRERRPNALANEHFVRFLERVERYCLQKSCYILRRGL